jgi:exonuclease SbcD
VEPRPIRILFLADSHLGFDLPTQPRVERRRRGHDFLANHIRALKPALEGEAELVVHGGDLFHRPSVPPSLVFQAFQSLLAVAESGIPVFLVPGNHERSRIPHERFAMHPNLHIFREPTTFRLRVGEARIALSGFPYHRKIIRERFPEVLKETGWHQEDADLRLLCVHHCVEGAKVGPADYTFRNAPDVIRTSDLPGEFAAVLSGHIHKHQILKKDLQGRLLKTPVYYPGSVERTAFAEAGEEKGYLMLYAAPGPGGGRIVRDSFVGLPARPMEVVRLEPDASSERKWSPGQLRALLREKLTAAPHDGVLQIRVQGQLPPSAMEEVSAATLRKAASKDMNVQLLLEDWGPRERPWRGRREAKRVPSIPVQHHLAL